MTSIELNYVEIRFFRYARVLNIVSHLIDRNDVISFVTSQRLLVQLPSATSADTSLTVSRNYAPREHQRAPCRRVVC